MEIAEKLAAAEVDGVTVSQAQSIIRAFLSEVARCPVCDGTGSFTFGNEVIVPMKDAQGQSIRSERRFIEAGTTSPCPRCSDGTGDPDFVAWHCERGDVAHERCERIRNGERRDGHARCGYRVMLPLEGAGQS
jgi:hypothetical protein